jgi:hypothetical protein
MGVVTTATTAAEKSRRVAPVVAGGRGDERGPGTGDMDIDHPAEEEW